MKSKLTIGEQLKQARIAKGMTQSQVFEKSRISVFTISGLETGRIKSTSTHTLLGLQYALGVVFEI